MKFHDYPSCSFLTIICEQTDGQDDFNRRPSVIQLRRKRHFPATVSVFRMTFDKRCGTLDLCNGGAVCFLWGRISVCKYYVYELRVSEG